MHEFSVTINQLFLLSLVAQSSPEINKSSQEKEHYIDIREMQIQELHQQLAASKQVTAVLQQNLLQREKLILKLQEENKHLRQEVNKVLPQHRDV